ncbi:MAG TPA: type III pantothenate kinase [Segetibacter sp.]|jgi:type III pantothenate kinase
MTTLCFDFGNSRLKCAVFVNKDFAEEIILQNETVAELENIIEKFTPARSILSSVIDHNPEIEQLLSEKTAFHKLSYSSKLPITSPVGKPHSIGADRLAMAVAAVDLFPREHNLVIGLGTCITYNFINKYHEFVGGSISPGMEMRFKSLEYYTAKLPLVSADWNYPLLGYDTKTNIQSGVMAGMAQEIDGIIHLYKEKFSNFNVHLTGGDMPFFGALLKNKIFADPALIYKGLYAISEYNQTKT